jgi:hypothetical protein
MAIAVMNRIQRQRAAFAAALALSVAPSLSAHEFWIEPTTFVPAAGKIVGIRARVGDGVLGDPVPRDPALLDQLIVDAGHGTAPIVGRDGADPLGLLRIADHGLHVIGYLGKPMPVELSAEKFNGYLEDEGLATIRADRARRGASNRGARELFTRCAKTLVLSGPATGLQHDRVLGFPLELVAESNPYLLEAGRQLTLQLRYRGQPLKGTLVTAIRRSNGERISVRSDASGRASFTLPGNGAWLIKAVHMVAAPAHAAADWGSFWASLTFELPA